MREKKYYSIFIFLTLLLVFEGVFRKILPSAAGTLLFFVKDFLCIYLIFHFIFARKDKIVGSLVSVQSTLFLLFIPILIQTATYDWILFFFGAKQYLLYLVVVALTFKGLYSKIGLIEYYNLVKILIIITTFVAVVQQSLPASHWLNRSVGGDLLDGFSAAGYLRVSSTFAFTAQYSYFLTFASALILGTFFLPEENLQNKRNGWFKIIKSPIVAISCLIIGSFITGGRTAVLGMLVIGTLGVLLIILKSRGRGILKLLSYISLSLLIGAFIYIVKPEYFAAYMERSKGYNGQSNSEEIGSRVLSSFTGGYSNVEGLNLNKYLLGQGLGVMSNGSNQISSYAREVRQNGFWTETDFATTAWEGGVYLLVIWYGFRLFVIVHAFKLWWRLKIWSKPGVFVLAKITVDGLLGTLALQPMVSIWWLICIGILFVMKWKEIEAKKAM